MDIAIDTPGEIQVILPENLWMPRLCYITAFVILSTLSVLLWKRGTSMETEDHGLSLRGELLGNQIMFLCVYCVSWFPFLFLGMIDGELETSSVSSGFRGQIANAHCGLMDVLTRMYCMSVVISWVIYIYYFGVKESDNFCRGRPSMFTWGILFPVVLVLLVRFVLDQEKWLMPTKSIISRLGALKFPIKSAEFFCVQLMDSTWFRQILAEWFLTVTMVVFGAYCCVPCLRNKEDSEGQRKASVSRRDSESCDLQMDSLLQEGSSPSPTTDRSVKGLSTVCGKLESDKSTESESLFVKCTGVLESIMIVSILWSIVFRPLMAIAMYTMHTETYSNYLDIPTHVLIITAALALPIEFCSKYTKKGEEGKKGTGERNTTDDNSLPHEGMMKDDEPVWIIDEERGTVCVLTNVGTNDEPIWIRENFLDETAVPQNASAKVASGS